MLRWKRSSLCAMDLVTILKRGVHMRRMKSKNRGGEIMAIPRQGKGKFVVCASAGPEFGHGQGAGSGPRHGP